MKKLLILLLAVIGQNVTVSAQSDNHPGLIPSVFYRGYISKRFDFSLFSSTTFIPIKSAVEGRGYASRTSEVYLQPSLVYKYSGRLNYAAGYTYKKENSFKPGYEVHQQVWQQVIFEHKAFRGMMLHRFRLVENLGGSTSPIMNYQVGFEKPLEGRILDEGELYFTCFNESFLNLSGSSKMYSSNWAFVGLGYKTSKAGKFEVGPLIQSTFIPQQNNSTLFLLQLLWIADSKIFKRG